ncbi:MAG: hypothetical protein AAGE59_34630 [Cyanobacteria bacterium P01_F01_bin.86]
MSSPLLFAALLVSLPTGLFYLCGGVGGGWSGHWVGVVWGGRGGFWAGGPVSGVSDRLKPSLRSPHPPSTLLPHDSS